MAHPIASPEQSSTQREIQHGIPQLLLDCWSKRALGDQSLPTEAAGQQNAEVLVIQFVDHYFGLRTEPVLSEDALKWVREPNYSIADFHKDITTFQKAIEQLGSDALSDDSQFVMFAEESRRVLESLFTSVLQQTSEVYEYMVERGGRGYCQINAAGKIEFANTRCHELLGLEQIAGKTLENVLGPTHKSFIALGLSQNSWLKQEIEIQKPDGSRVSLLAELRPVFRSYQESAAYMTLSDITPQVERAKSVFDHSKFGIGQIDSENNFTYANPAFLDMLQLPDLRGKNISHLIADEKSLKILQAQLEHRKAGLSTSYETNLVRAGKRKGSIPVAVTGMPVRDSTGKITGAVAIIKDLSIERAKERLYDLMKTESAKDWRIMLQELAKEVRKIVDFDMFAISKFSSDLRHVASFFDYQPESENPVIFQRRWYLLSEAQRQMVSDVALDQVDDLEAFMDTDTWAQYKSDAAVQELIKSGLLSFQRVRVHSEGKLKAAITLFRYGKNSFEKDDSRRLSELPLTEAINCVLHTQQQEALKTRYHLVTEIVKADRPTDVAKILVEKLGKYFEWNYVSIYAVDKEHHSLSLLAQWCKEKQGRLLPENYYQSMSDGIIGYVASNPQKRLVKVDNVRTDSKYSAIYLPTIISVYSELCIPIIWDGQVRWILDISDNRESAFSKDESDDIQSIVSEIENVLENLVSRYRLKSAFESTSDLVIMTNSKGLIREANPAAANFIGYHSPADLVQNEDYFQKLFDDPNDFGLLIADKEQSNREVVLKTTDNKLRSFLMSTFALPENFPGRVFVGQDLMHFKEARELSDLNDLFFEVAVQTHTPLSLVFTWLRRLREHASNDEITQELLSKSLAQLHKVQITFDRLSLFHRGKSEVASKRIRLNAITELRRSLDFFPNYEKNVITVEEADSLPYVIADPFQIAFTFQTIVMFLLRVKPIDENIDIHVETNDEFVTTVLRGRVPELSSTTVENVSEISKTLAEMSLGEGIIRTFVEENHEGRFEKVQLGQGRTEFRVSLPVAAN